MAFTKPCQFSSLGLKGLRQNVHLGCTAEERKDVQTVRFDIQIRFPSLPQGCFSDALDETVCYAEISNRIRSVCKGKEFHLIEKLGWDAFVLVKEMLPQGVTLSLQVVKEKPPIEDLEGGATFSVGDWI